MQAQELEPVVGARAVTVHRAVQIDGRHSLAVRVENPLHVGQLLDIRRAFVVNDDVVAGRPVGPFIALETSLGRPIGRVDDVDRQMGTGFQAGLQNVLLLVVFVTAAARDEQRLERFGRVGKHAPDRSDGGDQ